MSLISALFVLAAAAQGEHVAIQASDIDRSATFYHEAFGLQLIKQPLPNSQYTKRRAHKRRTTTASCSRRITATALP